MLRKSHSLRNAANLISCKSAASLAPGIASGTTTDWVYSKRNWLDYSFTLYLFVVNSNLEYNETVWHNICRGEFRGRLMISLMSSPCVYHSEYLCSSDILSLFVYCLNLMNSNTHTHTEINRQTDREKEREKRERGREKRERRERERNR